MYCEIISLKKYFSSYECVAMASFWFKVLSSINERNIIIQSRGVSLEIDLIKLQNIRNEWHIILNEVKLVASSLNILPNFQIKKRKKN